MKSKNLIILCVWIALSVISIVFVLVGVAYGNNPMQWLIDMKNDFFIFFILALIFTGAVTFLLPDKKEPETELLSELQNISSRLDELTRKVEEIKKTIKE